jgi:hypothetical protein
MYRSSFFRFVIAISASIFAAQGFAQQLTVQFRSGTSLTGHVEQPSIDWTTVSANGAVSQFNYKLSQIKTLSLSPTESSEQMIQIRQLLNQLGDDDYHQRELAEARLKSIGGQFRGTVESFADHPSYEVRYRVKRLLSEKSFRPTSSTRREVDRVTLVDGAQWEGEATNFALTLTAYGETIQLDRQKVAGLTSAAGTRLDARALAARDSPAKVELFHRYEDFVAEGQKEFRFDTQGDGSPTVLNERIDEAFVSDGLRFKNVEQGFVGISPFSFKYEKLPVGGRSVGLLGQRRGRDYKGVMEITFCQPGNANVSAGVYEFGTFIAKVSFRRDIILEAYGGQGELLATVEATDQKCVFAGVKSNQLITRVRVLSNPYLKKIERKIDDDFAIDTLRMSTPIPTRVLRLNLTREVALKNGDLLKWAGLNLKKDAIVNVVVNKVADQNLRLDFPLDEISSIYFARSLKSSNAWRALLRDGSQINVLPGRSFKSEQFGFETKPSDFVACWPAASAPRLPVAGDFMAGQNRPLIVFPTCRIRTEALSFAADRFSWKEKEKLQQPLQLSGEDSDEDPTPQQTAFKYADTLANQLPTVWMRAPTVLPAVGNFIYLTDGQRLAFGQQGQFELKEFGTRSITVAHRQGRDKTIPINDVYSIQFAQE